MMDILFINATTELTIKKEVNGTMLLATKLLQAGFDTNILRFGQIESYQGDYSVFIKDITQRILELEPRCVSFYSLWPDYHIMLRIAREIKARRGDIIVVFGGPQPSGTARETITAMDYVDYISTGEGEDTVVPLFRAMLRGEGSLDDIPGLFYRKDGGIFHNETVQPLCDLETLPQWDDRLLLQQPDPSLLTRGYFMPIDAGRGCPYNCTFCCTSHFWRRTYRLKSPDRIVADIKHFHEKFGIRSFWFSHDAFTINRNLVTQVCDRIMEEGLDITWRCSARVDCITEELILKMKQAGMIQIEMGVETGSLKMQKLTNKNLNLDKTRKMVEFLLKNKLRVGLFFMYGFPEETEEDLNDTLRLALDMVDMGVHYVGMSYCKFSPNTHLTETYLDRLVFDPSITINFHDTFGYQEEEQVIRDNKVLFPFYYHLDTPVRNRYQHLHFFVELYRNFPGTIRHLRKLYHGDDLKFYRDFFDANREILTGDVEQAAESIARRPLEMLLNTTKGLDEPWVRQLEGLLKYSYCVHTVAGSVEDVSVQDTYDFNYADLKLNHPIETYIPGKTEILVQKVDGKLEVKVLNIHWGE